MTGDEFVIENLLSVFFSGAEWYTMKIKKETDALKIPQMNKIQEKVAKLIQDYSDAEKEVYDELANYAELDTNVRWSTCVLVCFTWLLNHVTYSKLGRK